MRSKKSSKQGKKERKDTPPLDAVNKPFVLRCVDGLARYGLLGQVVPAPLTVAIAGKDGQPPTDANGRRIQVSVTWEVVKVPDGADTNLLPGNLSNQTVTADTHGRAQVNMRLGDIPGVYIVRATLPDYPDCVDAFFSIYTENVVSNITIFPIEPTPVDKAMRVIARASDWRGKPVVDAKMIAAIGDHGPLDTFTPVRSRGGKYEFAVRSKYAGKTRLIVGDVLSDYSVEAVADFLPGKARRLQFLPVENPRHRPPYNQTRVELKAFDKFGNLTAAPDIVWKSSSGMIEPVMPKSGTSAAALFTFEEKPTAIVTARLGRLSIKQTIELPGVYLRPINLESFSYVCDSFSFWVEVFPPARSGIAKALNVSLKQPIGLAERVSVSQPNPDSGVPLPHIREGKGGLLQMTIERMEVRLPEDGGRLVIAELEYHCIKPEKACFEVLRATITTSHSPDRNHTLHPGTRWCRTQKERNPKRLCLNFCLVAQPGGRTFEQLRAEAEAQVQRAQEIFNANIERCCPQINIVACYNELRWEDYRPIVNGGERPGALEGGIWQENGTSTYSGDSTRDAWRLSQELKDLLRQCRRARCHTVFIVPEFFGKSGVWTGGSNGVTISPNDFPETTGAAGSGTGTVMRQGLNVNDNTLIHELCHLLVDLPRSEDSGSEDITTDPDRVAHIPAPSGTNFTNEECSHIWDNIDRYGGDCE